jgi:CxxC-x17-CxxC domain-containing protein
VNTFRSRNPAQEPRLNLRRAFGPFRCEAGNSKALKGDCGTTSGCALVEKRVMADIEIMCAECSTAFPFTEREQDYYRERNLSHPKRCKPCRDARRSNFGGPKGAGGDRPRFEITCDQCGKSDSVPFKPSSGRPVLCGECFSASRAAPRV